MQGGFFFTTFFQPLYNGLIFLMDLIPWADAGVAVVLFTIIVKLALFPLSRSSVRTQFLMKKYDVDLKKIQETNKDNKQEQAVQTMAFYKEKKINPFSSIFLLFLQIPIIFALYKVFASSGLPTIKPEVLYSFVSEPEHINVLFIGLINISEKSIILGVLAAITSFFQIRYSLPPPSSQKPSGNQFKDDFAKSMRIQMQYVFPIMVLLISYNISGALALYWITSNLFTIGQEVYIRREMKLKHG